MEASSAKCGFAVVGVLLYYGADLAASYRRVTGQDSAKGNGKGRTK
jgi:hypothetical protein